MSVSLRGARVMTTTVWQPIVIRDLLLDVDDRAWSGREGGCDGEGHEAEESPSHKGAMRARGEVPLELQGVQRLSARSLAALGARSAVVQGSASTVVCAVSVQGVRWGIKSASTVVQRSQCKECGGACNLRARIVYALKCKECRWCEGHRPRHESSAALKCKECGGSQSCEHGRVRSECKECGGASICEHGRQRSKCKECGGKDYASTVVSALSARSAVVSSICEHGRQRSKCKECGGCINLRARSYTLYMQESAVGTDMRARSYTLYMQGVRWCINVRARSSAL